MLNLNNASVNLSGVGASRGRNLESIFEPWIPSEVISNVRPYNFVGLLELAIVELDSRVVHPFGELQSVKDREDLTKLAHQAEPFQATEWHPGCGAVFAVVTDGQPL